MLFTTGEPLPLNLPSPSVIEVFSGRDLLGDGVMKLPFLALLRRTWPKAHILWLTSGKSVFATALRCLTSPCIDEVVQNLAWGESWTDLFRPPPRLPEADLLIDTQRRVATSLALRRLRNRVFVSAALGWCLSDLTPLSRAKPASMLGQMLQLLEACGVVPDLASLPAPVLPAACKEEAIARLPTARPLVGLAPGAGDRHKCWPLARFLAIGRALAGRGITAAVLLGPREESWYELIRRELRDAVLPLRPGDSPLLTMAIARHLSVAVTNDGGIGHLLAAGGAPLISLFGPTQPEKFAPAACKCTIVRAQDFGGNTMAAIPLDAVLARVLEAL